MLFNGKTLLVSAALAAVAATGIQASAVNAGPSAADAVKARQQVLKGLEANMKPLAAIARGRADADKATMVKHAKNIAAYSRKIDPAFAMDTSKSGVDSDAKPGIWSSKADFNKKAAALVSSSNGLVAAANSGDLGKFRTSLMAVGQSCKDCHQSYRAK